MRSSHLLFLLRCMGVVFILPLPFVWADKKPEYHDIYLTNSRICKKCAWQWVDAEHVGLINKKGQRAIVHPREILGVDDHPVLRKLFLKSLDGIGPAAEIIVPHAFDNAKEHTCKYCDE